MKRILSLFIILVLMLSTFASCKPNTPAVEEPDIKEAIKTLDDMYEDLEGTSIPNGKELVAQVKVGKTVFTVTWESDNANVTFTYEGGLCKVNVATAEEDQEYTLTANVKSPAGKTASTSYKLLLSAAAGFGMITNPKAGVAYKLALKHGGMDGDPVVYFDGNNYNNYAWYFSFTEDVTAAVDVYLEEVEDVEGGYRLYFDKDGVKTYIVAFPRDGDTTRGTLKFDTVVPSEYWTYSTEYNTLVYTSVTGQQGFMGSSGTYKSISYSEISYVTNATNYPVRLFGAGGIEVELPEEELPTVPENYTSKDVVEALYKLQSGQTLEGPYEITGVITSIKYAYDPAYNNVSVNIVVDGMTDKPVLCYRLNGGEELKVGDTITVFAGITNYNGTYETTSGGVIRNVVPGEDVGGGDVGGGETTGSAVLDLTGNANLVTGSGEQNVFAANGITFTNDKASSSSALTVQASYAQRAYAGSTIKIEYAGMTKIVITFDDYSPDGTKNYMSGMDGMTVAGATITRENDVLTIVFNAATDVFQSTELTSQVRIEKIEVFTGEVEGGNGGNEGGNEGGDDPVVTPAYTAPVAGQPYDLYMELPTGKVYFNGALDAAKGTYLDTTADAAASVKIYFEEVSGGYHIFFMNGETKTYINAEAYLKSNGYAGCHFVLGETATCVWTYNTEYGILEVYGEISGKSDTFFAGTYGSYSTVSLSGQYYRDQIASGTQFPARIEAAEGEVIPPSQGGEETHTHTFIDGVCACGEQDPNYVPPSEGGDVEDGMMTIPEVLASAEGTVVKFTGTVHSFYEEWSSYNNCSPYIVDENGVKVLVFRTTTKVTVGDVVTVEGKVTIYNTVAQIAQGSSTVTIDVPHVCSSWTVATCGKDSACVVCGAAGADKATGNHNYVDGLCTVCGGSSASMKQLGTLSFSSTANRTSWDTEHQTWEANGITVTNNKGASTSNVADYSNPARFYKSSQLIVAATGILKIEFTCNSTSYASVLNSSITAADGVTVAVSGSVVTVTFANPVDSYTITSLTGGQVRMNSVTVYVAE